MKQIGTLIFVLLLFIFVSIPCFADSGFFSALNDDSKPILVTSTLAIYNSFMEKATDNGIENTVDFSFQSIQFSIDSIVFWKKVDGLFCEGYVSIPITIPLTYNDRFYVSEFMLMGFSLGKSFMISPDELILISIGCDNFSYTLNSQDPKEAIFGDVKDGLSINLGYLTKRVNLKLSFIDYYGRFAISALFPPHLDGAYKYYEPEGHAYLIKFSIGYNIW
jgi:hypothetical protein